MEHMRYIFLTEALNLLESCNKHLVVALDIAIPLGRQRVIGGPRSQATVNTANSLARPLMKFCELWQRLNGLRPAIEL